MLLAALALPLVVSSAPSSPASFAPAPFRTAQTSREDTLGKSYAQILAMGETRWTALYTKRQGQSTAAMAGGFITYGDALGWRNDRLGKGKAFVPSLRGSLTAFSGALQGIGGAVTGGGTMWHLFAGQSYRDVEMALYRVLTHTGKAPRRVVSDVERALAAYPALVRSVEDPKRRKEAEGELAAARAALRKTVTTARALPRRDSDTVLEFCRNEALKIAEQARPL